jgi:hypothetical protein
MPASNTSVCQIRTYSLTKAHIDAVTNLSIKQGVSRSQLLQELIESAALPADKRKINAERASRPLAYPPRLPTG